MPIGAEILNSLKKLLQDNQRIDNTMVNSKNINKTGAVFVGLILASIFISGCDHSNWGKSEINPAIHDSESRKSSIENPPPDYKIGSMNGVKLKIPDNYLQHGVVYEGDLRDGMGPASTVTAEDSRIDNFGVLLRLSDLQPIRTERDRQDWRAALAEPMFSRTWMMVSFDNHYPVKKPEGNKPEMLSIFGPYVLDKKMPYGLIHYESMQSVDDGARYFYGHAEYFYHDSSITTIMCQTHRKEVPPFDTFDTCEHHFLIPELNLMAEAFYTKKDLPRWSAIELRVNEIAHSFVAK